MPEIAIELHGGRCCGIKCINGLSSSPTNSVAPLSGRPSARRTHSEAHGYIRTEGNFYLESRPQETNGERFDAYLAYLVRHRPQGLVEVAISKSYQRDWAPFLGARGFKMVTEFVNSNSHSLVQVWHLVTDGFYGPVQPKSAPFRRASSV